MTVELGNINKGIPMGSYTPGEGGGAAKVTGVDPIAVTNGSVAIKIDEQTLQVNEQGELSANLDEIGSELNDLSGRVTAAEADILEKQGKLTARNPITIRTKEITNAKGFNTGTSTAATAQNVQKIWMSTSQNSGTIYIDSTFTLPIASYIAMPYTPGQIVKAPKSNAALAFGSFDDDNNFKLSLLFDLNYTSTSGFQLLGGPIYKTSSAATKDVLPNLDMTDFVYANGYGWRTRPTEAADSGNIYSTVSDEDKQCAFFQVSSDSANALFIQEFWNLTNSRASTAVHRDSETGFAFAGHCDEIRENINTALFLPMDTASSHDLTKLGVYNAPSDRMAWSSDSAWKSFRENKGTNFFNLGGTGVHNYLELNIGAGLAVTKGKLIASSTTPTNMLTTDTSQSITGAKTFNNETLILNGWVQDNNGNSQLKIGGSSLNEMYLGNAKGATNIQGNIHLWSNPTYQNSTNEYIHQGNLTNNLPISSTSTLGVVKPDGTSIIAASDGTISATGGSSTSDGLLAYRQSYGAPSNSVPVTRTGNSITIKGGINIKAPNGTLVNTNDMTYTYDFLSDRVLFVTENDYYHAYAVYYGGKEPSPVGEQIFWLNNNVWTLIASDGTKTVFTTQKITPIAKIYQNAGTVQSIDYGSYSNIATSGGGSTSIEKHGLEGDYCSKYGIVDCPNGILEEGTGQVTLKAGVVMQMTETDGLTTNASDMAHDITSTVDFDLFYTSGSLLEATQVVFSEQEPEDGATGVLAWYNGTQWKFKSNDAGNVWRTAPAVRLAHIHITDGNITRIDYIGNRHLNKVIPVTTNTAQTISGEKTFSSKVTITAKTYMKDDLRVTGVQFTKPTADNAIYDANNLVLVKWNPIKKTLTIGEKASSTVIGGGNPVTNKAGNAFLTSGDVAAYVTEEFIDGTEGYRLWSNGRCEQWGSFTGPKSITFLKNYADTNYTLLISVVVKTSGEAYNGVFGTEKTTTGFKAGGLAGTTGDAYIISTTGTCNWYTSGTLAT